MGTDTSVLATISFGLATIHNIGSSERSSDMKTVVPLSRKIYKLARVI